LLVSASLPPLLPCPSWYLKYLKRLQKAPSQPSSPPFSSSNSQAIHGAWHGIGIPYCNFHFTLTTSCVRSLEIRPFIKNQQPTIRTERTRKDFSEMEREDEPRVFPAYLIATATLAGAAAIISLWVWIASIFTVPVRKDPARVAFTWMKIASALLFV
jgi:hypothetical protein